jgi:hypothetical protein
MPLQIRAMVASMATIVLGVMRCQSKIGLPSQAIKQPTIAATEARLVREAIISGHHDSK